MPVSSVAVVWDICTFFRHGSTAVRKALSNLRETFMVPIRIFVSMVAFVMKWDALHMCNKAVFRRIRIDVADILGRNSGHIAVSEFPTLIESLVHVPLGFTDMRELRHRVNIADVRPAPVADASAHGSSNEPLRDAEQVGIVCSSDAPRTQHLTAAQHTPPHDMTDDQ